LAASIFLQQHVAPHKTEAELTGKSKQDQEGKKKKEILKYLKQS